MTADGALTLPSSWRAAVERLPADAGPSGAAWLATAPRTLADALERWDLTVDGPPDGRAEAVLVPVDRDGRSLTLVIDRPRPATRTAHVALRTWDGVAAAPLVASLPSRGLHLHPRLRALDETWWDDPVCEAVGRVLRRLPVPAPPPVPTVEAAVAPVLEALASLPAVPRRVATRVRGLAGELLPGPALPRLLHGRLDDTRLMLAGDTPVAVLPEPLAGDPAWDLWPVLRMRPADLGTGAALRWSVRHRLGVVADAAGLDPDRVRPWCVLRAGVEIALAARRSVDADLGLDLAVMKALDD